MSLPIDVPVALQSYATIVHSSKYLRNVADARNTGWKNGGAAGTNLDQLTVLLYEIAQARANISTANQTPGVQAVFRLASGNDTFDLQAELSTLNGLANTATAALLNAIPVDGSGAALLFSVDADGNRTHLHPTQGALNQVTSAVDALIAGIG